MRPTFSLYKNLLPRTKILILKTTIWTKTQTVKSHQISFGNKWNIWESKEFNFHCTQRSAFSNTNITTMKYRSGFYSTKSQGS